MIKSCSRLLYGIPVFVGKHVDVVEWLHKKEPKFRRMVTINPLILEASLGDGVSKEWIQTADIIVPDGVGVCAALRLKHGVKQSPITGVQLVYDVLSAGILSVYFLGAKADILESAVSVVKQDYPDIKVLGAHHGFFSDSEMDHIIDDISHKKPELILVGMGYPRQEWVIKQLSRSLSMGTAIGVGGVIDVLSGHSAWAPKWVRFLKLEWLFRMIQQPARFKQVPHLIRFIWKCR